MGFGRATGQSDFSSGELTLAAMRTGIDLLKIQIPLDLTKRTLWGFHFAVNATTDWYFQASIKFLNGGGNVAEFPFNGGQSVAPSVMPRSLPSILVFDPAIQVGHALQVVVKEPLQGPPIEKSLYFCQPFEIEIISDLISVSVTDYRNITALHIWLGVQSSL